MKLNSQQQKAKEHPAGPLLILAGAGTGKTTTIVQRMAYLISQLNLEPSSILALTFSVKAADHLKEKLVEKIGEEGENIHASTFHSFAQSVIDEFKSQLKLLYRPNLMNDSEINFLIREHFNELDYIHSELFRRNPIDAIKTLKTIFDQFREELFTDEKLEILFKQCEKMVSRDGADEKETEHFLQLMDAIQIYPLYQQWKKDENRIDYGDMISNLWRLILSSEKVKSTLQQRYTHIIVDEFQDNNHALSQVINVIAQPQNNITVVGDDDQCIYSFRGANIQNVSGFKSRHDSNPEYAEIPLMENYRSIKPILKLANEIIQFNPDRVEKGALHSQRESTFIPKLYEGTKDQQIAQIKVEIDAYIQDGVNLNKIAILSRTHKNCKLVSEFLSKNRIKNQYYAERLFDNKLIKDVICGFQILGKTSYWGQSIYRLIKNRFGVELAFEFTERLKYNKSRSLSELVENYSFNNEEFKLWMNEIISISKILTENDILKITERIIKWSDIYKDNIHIEDHQSEINIQILNQLLVHIKNYEQSYPKSDFNQFVRYINISWEVNDISVDPTWNTDTLNGVQIMTVHQSKGKEFSHVIIPFLVSAGFPLNYQNKALIQFLPANWRNWEVGDRSMKDLHIEEERRIFYVAITRAENSLVLMTTEKRQSPFIKNISSEFLEREKIMTESTLVEKLDTLISTFENKLLDAITFEKWEDAHHLVHSIQCIKDVKNGVNPQWGENPYKSEIEDSLFTHEDVVHIPTELVLSATKISTYDRCPLQYRFKEIDKIPLLVKKPYFQLGSVIHKVLEIFHEKKMSTKIELLSLLDQYWTTEGFEYKQEEQQYKKDAVSMIENYFNFFQENPVHPQFVEEAFSFKLKNCTINGKCDRIDVTEKGHVEIYDYKTSKKQLSPKELKKDIQLTVYALFLLHDGIEVEAGKKQKMIAEKLALLSLRHEEIETSVKFELDELVEKKDEIEVIADKIRAKEFDAKKGHHCEYCEFKDLVCPEFN
ncbi:MAG: ATP-dependent helicase [Candidatus Marinimicrobia bacterium]|nr:ATP-dependent helicase [Candidatus Neomarinimicrobiota bacterium]